MKKKVLYIILSVLLFSGGTNNIYAKSSEEECSTRGPSCNYSRYYIPYSSKIDVIPSEKGTFTNNTSQVQSKSFTYYTTLSTSINTGLQADLDTIGAKLSAYAYLGIDKKITYSKTTTLNFAPYKTSDYVLGQEFVNTTGRIETINYDCAVSSKYINASYSTGFYDEVTER